MATEVPAPWFCSMFPLYRPGRLSYTVVTNSPNISMALRNKNLSPSHGTCPSLVNVEFGSSWSLSLNIASCCAKWKESSEDLSLEEIRVTSAYSLLVKTSHVVLASHKGSMKHSPTVCLEGGTTGNI